MLAESITSFVSASEMAAAETMRTGFGVDVTRTYQFWEAAVARLTGGSLTRASCPWDVELPYIGRPIRIEVKYAQESWCQFRTGRRAIFKFAAPKGMGAEKSADVIALIGLDELQDVHAWVLPARRVRKCASITLTSPRFRIGASRSRGVGDYYCPPTQVLPEVLRAYREHVHHDCHLHYHRETAARTRAAALAEAGQLALPLEMSRMDQQTDETDEPRRPWAEQSAEERAEFWDGIVIARDEQRYAADPLYQRQIDWLQSGYRWTRNTMEWPVALEYRTVKVAWQEAENAADALKRAKDREFELAESVEREQPVDAWVTAEPIPDWDFDTYVYDGFGDPFGPRLPNGGQTVTADRRTAEYNAYREAELRAEVSA